MSRNIYLKTLISAAVVLFTNASCKKDFLTENLTTAVNTGYYKTDAGILQLSVGTYYQTFASPLNGEWYYTANNYGTDEFHIGGDPSNSPWNNYDQTFNSVVTAVNGNTVADNVQWDALYTAIGDANLLIQNAARVNTGTSVRIWIGEQDDNFDLNIKENHTKQIESLCLSRFGF